MKIKIYITTLLTLSLAACHYFDEDRSNFTQLPSIENETILVTDSSTISFSANINDGGSDIESQGICWSLSQNPTIDNEHIEGSINDGVISGSVNNLKPNTTYYARIYAKNKAGIFYGTNQSFFTKANGSISIQCNQDSVDYNWCKINAQITNTTSSSIIESGICWSSQSNPDMHDSIISNTSAALSFSQKITELPANTTIFIRAYTINLYGISYSNEISITTLNGLVDIDGNSYRIVTIGGKTWMADNLKTTKFNDGSSISQINNDTAWYQSKTAAFCWQNNDPNNKSSYGALYNWYAVNSGKLAPKGWHIATDQEWAELASSLGGNSTAGGQLKSNSALWATPNNGANNAANFNAEPGSRRGNSTDGSFQTVGTSAYFWTKTEYNNNMAWFIFLTNTSTAQQKSFDPKHLGLSIRCVKDY